MTDKNDVLPVVHEAVEALNKKVDAVIDHTASQFGKLEESLSLFETRLNASSDVIENIADKINTILIAEINSNSKANIYAALASAQQEIENADANIENEFLKKKYADLASCLNAVRGPLSKNGIAVIQLTEDVSQSVLGIRTILAHESGETIEDHITMAPPKLDPQGVGSCRTYMRRYSIIAMCGIAGALDDDAEGTKADPTKYDRISVEEAEGILVTANNLFGSDDDAVIERMLAKLFSNDDLTITSVTDIPAGKAEIAVNLLKNQHKREQDAIKKKAKPKAD